MDGGARMTSGSETASSSTSVVHESTSVAATAATYAHTLQAHLRRATRSSLPSVASIKRVPKIKLTAEEHAHYDRVVGRLLYHAVQEYASFHGKIDAKLWTHVRSNPDMVIYKRHKGESTDNPRVSLMLGVGKIDGTLEDVMDGVYSDTSSDLRTVTTFLKSKCIAGKVLTVSETRTPDEPFTFAGIKWLASKMPGGAISSDRDLLYYERQGLTFDAQGDEVAYHLMQSVDRPEWPANTFRSLIRSHSSICYLYKRKGDKVETFFWGEFYSSGSIPQRLSDYAIAGKWMSVANALKCAEAKKFSQLQLQIRKCNANPHLHSSPIVNANTICYICQEQPSMFSSQQPCGSCKQTVCKSCSAERNLFKLDRTRRPVADRFCQKCLAVVAKQHGSKISWEVETKTASMTTAPVNDQASLLFDLAFLMASAASSSGLDSVTTPHTSALATRGSDVIDTAYLDRSLQQLEFETSNSLLERPTEDEVGFARRKRSHADRLSSSSYSKEQFLSELFEEPSA